MWIEFVCIVLAYVIFKLFSFRSDFSVLPPGPPDHFLFGNFKYLQKSDPLLTLSKLCWKYGKNGMMRNRFPFQQPIVVIFKLDAISEFFDKYGDNLNERGMTNYSLQEFTGNGKDILMASGEYWRTARKMFVQGVMSNVGRSIPIIETHIKNAIESIRQNEGKVVEIGKILSFQTFSVIADMSVGRIPIDPYVMKEFIAISEELNDYATPQALRNVIPGYSYYPFDDHFRKLVKRRDQILQGIIDEHRRTLDPENPKDFLDSILIDSEKENDISVSILHILLDTFVGGTDTSSNTIEFLIGYLANHPDIQRKVHEELDSNVKGRCPTIDDESNLPYLCAALKEAMRIAPVAAVLVRRANEDMYLRGYKIPKGYRTICLAHALGHDPDLWKNPEEFRPERFLEEDKDVSLRGAEMPKNRDHLKATFFGLGKRACAGYQLARKELFLQAAYYLWAFEFSTPTPNQKLDLTMLGGLVAKAKTPVIVRAKYRQSMKS